MVVRKFKKAIVTFSIAVILITSSANVSHAAILRFGSRGSEVQKLQNQLKSTGHLVINNTTTYFGSMTDSAVRSFQRSKGLVVDGIAGKLTMQALSGISSNSNSSNSSVSTILRFGSRGSNVKNLQNQLKSLGFLKITNTTTYFGSMTDSAVRSFQRSKGLVVDGIAGKLTMQALNGTSSNSNSSVSTILRFGSRGSNVKNLQDQLKSLGFLKITNTTSYFGSMTDSAVRAFQRSERLVVDGIVGQKTINALNNPSSSQRPNGGSETNKNDLGTRIANNARQHLGKRYVFGGNGPSTFDCSGLTVYVYRQFGINLPRTTTGQATVGTRVSKSNLRIGDLVVFSNTYKAGPSHVGVYIGNGDFVHSANANTGVIISNINSSYYNQKFSYGRRLF